MSTRPRRRGGQSYDARYPAICMDEQPKPCLAATRPLPRYRQAEHLMLVGDNLTRQALARTERRVDGGPQRNATQTNIDWQFRTAGPHV